MCPQIVILIYILLLTTVSINGHCRNFRASSLLIEHTEHEIPWQELEEGRIANPVT